MGGRQDIVSGLPSAYQGLNDTTWKYREPALHRLGPMGRKKPGGDGPVPRFFLPAMDHSKAQFVLADLLEEVPHAKQTHLPITCCHVAACGEAVAPREASLCILLPLSWSHFLSFSLLLLWDCTYLRVPVVEFPLKLCFLEDPD